MSGPETVGQRLKRLRIAAGYKTTEAFAKAAGVAKVTYQHHENGKRTVRLATVRHYADILKVPAGLISYGEQLSPANQANLRGRIVGDGRVHMDAAFQGVEAPPLPGSDGLSALEVETDQLWPAYRPGELVYYREAPASPRECNGRDCVVFLTDGSIVIRMFTAAGPNRATLVAFSGPPMLQVEYTAAYPIVWMKRAPVPIGA